MTTSTPQKEENLETYLEICANSYGDTYSQKNPMCSEWEKLNLEVKVKLGICLS